jgi:molybdopterin molybdotransferase
MPLLSLDEAYRRLLARAHETNGEPVGLDQALGRVLVEPRVVAGIDVPPFANSAMDGWALRSADTPGALQIAGEVVAGAAELPMVQSGQAFRISTGAPLPRGADAVVPLEDVEESGEVVRVPPTTPGAFVRLAGSDTPVGTEVCLTGALTPAAIAVLASLGVAEVVVRRRPAVAILSTGDELAPIGAALAPGQIHDTNGVALAAAVREAGALPFLLDPVPDDPAAVEAALRTTSKQADLLVSSGGVSVGRHDHVRTVLERHGSLDFWRIAVQPGKPLAVGAYGGVTVIGLPGNPVSALVTFELFVRPFIRTMLGLTGDGRLRLSVRPETRISKDPDRRAFLRVSVWREKGETYARATGGQGSAQLRPLAEANALLVVPAGEEAADPNRYYEAIVTAEFS